MKEVQTLWSQNDLPLRGHWSGYEPISFVGCPFYEQHDDEPCLSLCSNCDGLKLNTQNILPDMIDSETLQLGSICTKGGRALTTPYSTHPQLHKHEWEAGLKPRPTAAPPLTPFITWLWAPPIAATVHKPLVFIYYQWPYVIRSWHRVYAKKINALYIEWIHEYVTTILMLACVTFLSE